MSAKVFAAKNVVLSQVKSNHPTRFSQKISGPAVFKNALSPFLTDAENGALYRVNNCKYGEKEAAEVLKAQMESRKSATFDEIIRYQRLTGKRFISDKITHFQAAGCRFLRAFERCTSGLPSLISIDLGSNTGIANESYIFSRKTIDLIKIRYPNLEELNLQNWGFLNDNDLDLLFRDFIRLHTFNVADVEGITLAGLQHLNPNLRNLNISNCDDVVDAGLLHLTNSCPNLEALHIKGLRCSSLGLLEIIPRLQKLQKLFASGTLIITSTLSSMVMRCPDITTLDLSDCRVFADWSLLQGFSKLQSVDVSRTSFGDDHLGSLSACPNLQNLVMNGSEVTDAGLRHFKLFKELKDLEIGGYFTDVGLRQLGLCPKLQRLRIGFGLLHDQAVQGILEECPHLTSLVITDPEKRLQGAFFPSLVRCPRLKHLEIDGSASIEEKALINFPESPELQTLTIRYSRYRQISIEARIADLAI